MHDPLVSIIIPIYNAEKYLQDTIRSVINQTWQHKEIILIDDGSTDNSLEVAKKFECAFIKVHSQNNKGAATARNRGMLEAKGEYLQFLDADDLLAPDKISRQLSMIGNQEDTLGICPVIHFTSQQAHHISELGPDENELKFYANSNNPFEFLLNLYGINGNGGSMIPIHSWLTPMAVIKEAGYWNEGLTMNDDGEFFCRVVVNAAAIINVNDTFCYYRKTASGESLSSTKGTQAYTSQFKSILLIKNCLESHSQDERVASVTARMLKELLVQTYPQYRQLTLAIESELVKVGGSNHQPIIGGKIIELIKQTFGWRSARVLQHYYQNGIYKR